jgi:hypothetical protein
MKKITGIRAFFKGSLVLMFLAVGVLALSGCGGEKKQAPAEKKKAEAPAGMKKAMPSGHPSLQQTTDEIAKASHSLIKTSKAVKISDDVMKRWKTVTLEISDNKEKASKAVELAVGSTTQLTDDGYKVRIEVFVPDYAIVGDHIESRSNDPNNPAALIDLLKGDKVVTRGWIFAQFPEFNSFNDKRFGFVLKAAGKIVEKKEKESGKKAKKKAVKKKKKK